jgi:hypothetical protein
VYTTELSGDITRGTIVSYYAPAHGYMVNFPQFRTLQLPAQWLTIDSPAPTSTVNITSSSDTDIVYGNVNRGSYNYMLVGHWTPELYPMKGLIVFDISSLHNNHIISATLHLYENGGNGSGFQQSLYNITSPWNEMTADWNTKPDYNPLPFTYTNGTATPGWYVWNVTGTVTAWQDGTLVNNGILLAETSDNTNNELEYSTKENVTNKPYLSINYN